MHCTIVLYKFIVIAFKWSNYFHLTLLSTLSHKLPNTQSKGFCSTVVVLVVDIVTFDHFKQ